MTKKIRRFVAALILTFNLSIAAQIMAQQPQEVPETQLPNAPRRQFPTAPKPAEQIRKRPNLLQFLNLTPEQIQQIRVINQETRETARAANGRQRAARRRLDNAIYADAPNQIEVEQRAREFAEAQTEAIKIRATIEFRIRQILNADQLMRFRALRQQFEQRLRQSPLRRGASQPPTSLKQSNN